METTHLVVLQGLILWAIYTVQTSKFQYKNTATLIAVVCSFVLWNSFYDKEKMTDQDLPRQERPAILNNGTNLPIGKFYSNDTPTVKITTIDKTTYQTIITNNDGIFVRDTSIEPKMVKVKSIDLITVDNRVIGYTIKRN